MGRPAGWMKELTGRSPMKSPGAPSLRREVERAFWLEIAKGVTSEEAAAIVGVSSAVGTRWFRHRGGMPIDLSPATGRYLSFSEREEIALMRAQGEGVRSNRASARPRAVDDLARVVLRYSANARSSRAARRILRAWVSEANDRHRQPHGTPSPSSSRSSRSVVHDGRAARPPTRGPSLPDDEGGRNASLAHHLVSPDRLPVDDGPDRRDRSELRRQLARCTQSRSAPSSEEGSRHAGANTTTTSRRTTSAPAAAWRRAAATAIRGPTAADRGRPRGCVARAIPHGHGVPRLGEVGGDERAIPRRLGTLTVLTTRGPARARAGRRARC